MPGPNPLHAFLAATGAVVPPAVLEGGLPELRLDSFPPGTQRIRLPMGKDDHLEGVYVPAENDSPLVLHMLESEGSVTHGARGLRGYPVLWDLRDLGIASLMLDYRGVGASVGSRSPRNLPEDAMAAWKEALRYVGGDPQRIVIRGMSLGTLATATLLQREVKPAAVVLVAPVRAETVVPNWARHYYPEFIASITSRFVRPSVDVDVIEVYSQIEVPLLVHAPRDDYLLPGWERLLYEEAVAVAGGTWLPSRFGHPANVLVAHRMFEAEAELYKRLFPELPPLHIRLSQARQALTQTGIETDQRQATEAKLASLCGQYRVDPPMLLQALAQLAVQQPLEESLLEWLRVLPPGVLDDAPPDACQHLLDLEDPAGDISAHELRQLALYLHESRQEAQPQDWWTPEQLEEIAEQLGFHRAAATRPRAVREEDGWVWVQPAQSQDLLFRRGLRCLFKAAGYPDRLQNGTVEYWYRDAWQGSKSV